MSVDCVELVNLIDRGGRAVSVDAAEEREVRKRKGCVRKHESIRELSGTFNSSSDGQYTGKLAKLGSGFAFVGRRDEA